MSPIAMVVPKEAIPYILLQRTYGFQRTRLFRTLQKTLPKVFYNKFVERATRKVYVRNMQREFERIQAFLPPSCSAVLDIGCGVAGIDVFLYRHYLPKGVHLNLLDKTQVEDEVFYGYGSRGAYYNSLEVAKLLLTANGVREECIHLRESNERNELRLDGKVDLVVSFISWGFHYPVETYLERVCGALTDDGVLILDLRKGTNGMQALREAFSDVERYRDTDKMESVVCRGPRR